MKVLYFCIYKQYNYTFLESGYTKIYTFIWLLGFFFVPLQKVS